MKEVCEAIWKCFQEDYMKMPNLVSEWESIAKEFEQRWNFPNCLGAIDGKHIIMNSPKNTGSIYYNYKGSFSIVLLALSDANNRFIYVDIGAYGRCSDGGIFSNSSLKKQWIEIY